MEGPTGHHVIPRDRLFRGNIVNLSGLSREERELALRVLPDPFEGAPYTWWREGYGFYDAVGKAAGGTIHTVDYGATNVAPERVNALYTAALNKLATLGPVALIVGLAHVEDIAKMLERGEGKGKNVDVHVLRWEPSKRRWRLVEKI